MICEKCGKSNIMGLTKCAYCQADMPPLSGGNGFADILSYKPSEEETRSLSEGISEKDMQKLIKKSDKIIESTRQNNLFGLIAIALSLIILISSIIIGVKTMNAVKEFKTAFDDIKVEEKLEAIEKQQKEQKEKVDLLTEKIGETEETADDPDCRYNE